MNSDWITVLDKIDQAGGRLSVADGRLRVEAPAGLLSDQDRAVLARHRAGLIDALTPARRQRHGQEVEDQAVEEEQPEDLVVVDPIRCDGCGGLSLDLWQDLRGGLHCLRHDPPVVAQRLRQAAERIRRRHMTRRVEP